MRLIALGGLIGASGLSLFAELPAYAGWPAVLSSVILLAWLVFSADRRQGILYRLISFLIGLLFGFGISCVAAVDAMAYRFPLHPVGIEAELEGKICSIPRTTRLSLQFELCDITGRTVPDEFVQTLPRRVLMHWYQSNSLPRYGEIWRVKSKLKTPYAKLNPDGFDAERWAMVRRLDAIGSVKDAIKIAQPSGSSIAILRANAIEKLSSSLSHSSHVGWHLGLTTGYRSALETDEKELLQETGVAHIMAISGLHIGLIFIWISGLIGWLWRRSVILCSWVSAPHLAYIAGLLAAWGFCLFSGAEQPAMRASIALSLWVIARLLNLNWTSGQLLATTIIVLLIYDPLEVFSEGFWLTLSALTLLTIWFQHCRVERWYQWILLQAYLSLGMSLVASLVFGHFMVAAILANILCIPIISNLVLPLDLIALALIDLPPVSALIFQITDWLVASIIWSLSFLHELLPPVYFSSAQTRFFVLMFICFGSIVWFRTSFLFLLALVPLSASTQFMSSQNTHNAANVYFFDVGQGLAIAFQYQDKWLVYDTGYGDPSFRVADSTLVPFLRARGVSEIDWLVISHLDADHAGGVASLEENFEVVNRIGIGDEPSDLARCEHTRSNYQQLELQWFRVMQGRNNGSCLVRLKVHGVSILLTGDIEHEAEWQLVTKYTDGLAADIISMPHHGSKTSSTYTFIAKTSPELVWVGAGFQNRFNHPAKAITRRYQRLGSSVFTGWQTGMVSIQISEGNTMKVNEYRRSSKKFWNHHAGGDNSKLRVLN